MEWISNVTEQPVVRMPMSKDAQCIVCGEHVTFRTAESVTSATPVTIRKPRRRQAYLLERNYGRHKECARQANG